MTGRNNRVTMRVSDDRLERLDQWADEAGLSRSEILRRSHDYAEAAQGDTINEQADIEDRIDDTIGQNQKLRKALPSKWRAHVRRLLIDDIRDDISPTDLRHIADGYRKQARQYADWIETIPHAPDVEPGTHEQIVDEELTNALEAVDISNWYDRVENPFEHLEGVEDGKKERQDVVALVQGVLHRRTQLKGEIGTMPPLTANDLPERSTSILPDRVDTQDLIDVVNELVNRGADPEDVPHLLPTIDPTLGSPSTEDVVDVDGQGQDPTPAIDLEPVDDEDDQASLPVRIPAGDGGRDPRTRSSGWDEHDVARAAGYDEQDAIEKAGWGDPDPEPDRDGSTDDQTADKRGSESNDER